MSINENLRSSALLPLADSELQELKQHCWNCFHCGFATDDPREAASHFGDRDDEEPMCLHWSRLSTEERLGQFQSLQQELDAERDENAQLRTKIEGLEYRVEGIESQVASRFKGCRSINDAFHLYDSMEGRALAAEERLKACGCEETNRPLRNFIALKILRAWNHGPAGYCSEVVGIVNAWLDGGSKGPIPFPSSPFFAEWAQNNGYSNIDGFVGFRFMANLVGAE